MNREIRERQLAELDAMHERLKATPRRPDLDRSPAATAARRERRMRMTGQVERLVPGRPTAY